MNKTCGTCKHWRPFGHEEDERYEIEGFGTCGLVEHLSIYYRSARNSSEPQDKWLFGVVDGSDYFAALKTKEAFGCNQWEAAVLPPENVLEESK